MTTLELAKQVLKEREDYYDHIIKLAEAVIDAETLANLAAAAKNCDKDAKEWLKAYAKLAK